MKKIVSMLLAAVLSLGMLAGCGEKMSEEEKAYKESCKPYTYDELMEMDRKLQIPVLVTGEIIEHRIDSDNKPFSFIKDEEGNEIELRNYDNGSELYDSIEQFEVGEKIKVWGGLMAQAIDHHNT